MKRRRLVAALSLTANPTDCESPMRIGYAIAFVSDMARSVAFYRDVIGIPLKFESPHWSEFATEGATLALHATEETADHARPPKGEPAGTWRSGFQVPDLSAFHARVSAQGVVCLEPPTVVFGSPVAVYLDPDGLAISVGELPRG